MGDHRTIADGDFIICEREFRTGRPCGGGWINREEREVSRHYQRHHGYAERQNVNYQRCAIVSEAAVRGLVSTYKMNQALTKNDGREERAPRAPRYPHWMPGGGRSAYLAALAANHGAPRHIDDSEAESDADSDEEEEDELADDTATRSVFHPYAGKKIRARAAAIASDPEGHLGILQATGYDQEAPKAAAIPTFGDWDRGESGLRYVDSSSEASEASDSSDNDADMPPKRPSAIKTVPGYGGSAALESPAAEAINTFAIQESIDVHDFTGYSHAQGFLTRAAFDSIVGTALDAINPFCMSTTAWDHALRVVYGYFRTDRSDIIKESFVEFLGLFGHKADFITDQLSMAKWFYEGRSRTEDNIWENAAALSTEPDDDEDSDDESWDKVEPHRCYVCGVKIFCFRELDDHYQAEHGEERAVELSAAYRGLWETKLLAMGLEIDDNDEEGGALAADRFACHHCHQPFDDLDAIDRHFQGAHSKPRKNVVLRIFDKKFKLRKESNLPAWFGKDPVFAAEQSAEEEEKDDDNDDEPALPSEEENIQQLAAVNNGESSAAAGAKRARGALLSNDGNDVEFGDLRPAKMQRSKE